MATLEEKKKARTEHATDGIGFETAPDVNGSFTAENAPQQPAETFQLENPNRPQSTSDLGMDQWAVLQPGQYDLEKIVAEREALPEETRAALDEVMLANANNDDMFLSLDAIQILSDPNALNQSPELKAIITDKYTEMAQDKEAFEARIIQLLESGQPEKATDLLAIVANQTDIDVQEVAQTAYEYMVETGGVRYGFEANLLNSLVPYDLTPPALERNADAQASLETHETGQPDALELETLS